MHIFSEGGADKACELALAYRAATGRRLPIATMCLDSTPGHPRFLRLCSALAKSFPPIPILKHLAKVVAIVTLAMVWIVYHIFKGYEKNPVSRSRKHLLDPELFDLTIPRCYLYSTRDALIAWQDISDHASELIRCQGCVTEVKFEGSEHVSHAKMEPQRYWDTVRMVWVHSQERHGQRNVMVPVEESQGSELVLKEGTTTAVIPAADRLPMIGVPDPASGRYSVFV